MPYCPPEHSGCWYCSTDDNIEPGWWMSCEFDCVLHAKCIEDEINNQTEPDFELEILMEELGYALRT